MGHDENHSRSVDGMDFKRATDEQWTAEAEISSHKMLYIIYQDVQEMKGKLHKMEGILTVWTNTKGFITTVHIVGKTIFWLGTVVGALAALWYAFKKAVTGL